MNDIIYCDTIVYSKRMHLYMLLNKKNAMAVIHCFSLNNIYFEYLNYQYKAHDDYSHIVEED